MTAYLGRPTGSNVQWVWNGSSWVLGSSTSRIFSYDLDFTALSNQSMSNGANVISGKTWYVSNFSAASTFDIVSGTGLRIFNNTTNTDYNNGTRSAPIIEIKITDIYSDYDPGVHRVRFLAQFTGTTDQNFETVRVGFERSGSETTQNFQTGKQFSTSLLWFSTTTSNASSTGFTDSSDTTHDVAVVEFFDYSDFVSLSGVYGSDWPASNQLKIRNRATQNNVNGGIKIPADLAALLCSSTTNTNGNLQTTFKRVRVEIFTR